MPLPSLNQDAYREALVVAFAAAQSAADRHRTELMKDPGVVDVSAGYKFQGGWITDTPAVVVTVLRKDPPETLGERALPATLDGVPVDVAPATPLQQLRPLAARQGVRAAVTQPPPGVPDLEPFLKPGDPEPAVSEDVAARGTDGGRGYKEPPNLQLSAVKEAMTLLCHSSPDAGW